MRHPNIATRENTTMVVIDVQEKLFPAISEKQAALDNMRICIETAKLFGLPVVATEQYPQGLGPTIPEVQEVLPPCPVISKVHFSCFGSDEFTDTLAKTGAQNLIIVGIETHICVAQTSLDALARGYKVFTIGDATSSRTRANWSFGLDKMRQAGVMVSSTEAMLYEIAERAATEEFKALLKLVK